MMLVFSLMAKDILFNRFKSWQVYETFEGKLSREQRPFRKCALTNNTATLELVPQLAFFYVYVFLYR